MKIELWFSVHTEPALGGPGKVLYKRVVDWPSVPRVGDQIEFTDGGWSEVVKDVWWTFDGSVTIEFDAHATESAGETLLRSMSYVDVSELPALEEAGWERV